MAKEDTIDEFVRQFFALLPQDLRRVREDMDKNARAALNAALRRMDLVTREEFDVQTALLSRTRALLEELEGKIKELETELNRRKHQD